MLRRQSSGDSWVIRKLELSCDPGRSMAVLRFLFPLEKFLSQSQQEVTGHKPSSGDDGRPVILRGSGCPSAWSLLRGQAQFGASRGVSQQLFLRSAQSSVLCV